MEKFRYRHLVRKRLSNFVRRVPLDYERRNERLSFLGFSSYSHYLNSPIWQIIRESVLNLDGGRCVVCAKIATVVHHNSYEIDTLVGKDISQLVSLCHYHHKMIEFKDGKKGDLMDARAGLEEKGIEVPPLERTKLPPPPQNLPFVVTNCDETYRETESTRTRKGRRQLAAVFRQRLQQERVVGRLVDDAVAKKLEKREKRKAERRMRRSKCRSVELKDVRNKSEPGNPAVGAIVQ